MFQELLDGIRAEIKERKREIIRTSEISPEIEAD